MATRPGFVKIYRPSRGDENLKIPSRFIQSIQGNGLENVALRDRYNNLWLVKVEMAGGYFYFKDGWTKFADDNMIEEGNSIVYEYFSDGILDFKVYDHSDCLREGVGGHISNKPDEQDRNIEPDYDVVTHTDDNGYDPTTEVENWQDDHPQAEQVMGGEDHCFSTTEEENQSIYLFEAEEVTDDESADDDCIRATEDDNDRDDHCKRANVMDVENQGMYLFEAEEVTDDESADDDDCIRATEDDNDRDDHCKRANVMDAREVDPKRSQEKNKRRPREDGSSNDHPRVGQVRAGCTSSTRKRSKRDHDWYGKELFRSGVVQQPLNAYFVTKKKKCRAGELLVPKEVIRAYNLELPESILLIDPQERQFHSRRKTWLDGRTVYSGGWRTLCGMNFVGDEHNIICEFVHVLGDLCIRVSFVPPEGQQ